MEIGGVEDERCIGQYRSVDKILLVGEGDFSFALCFAKAFGSARNMVATSFDSKEILLQKYSRVAINLKELEELGCTIYHDVDAHTMSQNPNLIGELFDRIVFNFPHAGFHFPREHQDEQIEFHKKLVKGFFLSSRNMLKENGKVHVTHKTAHPFYRWNVKNLAEEAGLELRNEDVFCRWRYPGYMNKRGDGSRSDRTFPEEVVVSGIDGDKFWVKIVIEKRRGRFTRLLEAMASYGFDLSDTSVTTSNIGAFFNAYRVEGIYGDALPESVAGLQFLMISP